MRYLRLAVVTALAALVTWLNLPTYDERNPDAAPANETAYELVMRVCAEYGTGTVGGEDALEEDE